MSPSGPSRDGHLGLYRLILAAYAVAAPLGGLLAWTDAPGFDPMPIRLLLSALAFGLVAGSFRAEPVRRILRPAIMTLGHLSTWWFLCVGAANEMAMIDALGLVPIVLMASIVCRRPVEVLLGLVVIGTGVWLTYLPLRDPALSADIMAFVLLLPAIGLGSMSVSRARLEEALGVANETLEYRVVERTLQLNLTVERLEREVQDRVEAEVRATAASRAKSAFLANMSHELRTPLNAVIGYAELASEVLCDLGVTAANIDLQRVDTAAKHLLGIIDNVLDLSRIEADQMTLILGPIPVVPAIFRAVERVRPLAEKRGTTVRLVLSSEEQVIGDEVRLEQVLAELLSNAVRFTEQGEIVVRSQRTGAEMELEVSDTGPGMAPAVVARLFERFYQADDSATRTHGGVGLGLAISRELVQRMGGRLGAESVLGAGSTFRVTLPVA